MEKCEYCGHEIRVFREFEHDECWNNLSSIDKKLFEATDKLNSYLDRVNSGEEEYCYYKELPLKDRVRILMKKAIYQLSRSK